MHSSSSAFDRKCGGRASGFVRTPFPSGILRGLYTLRDGVCVLFAREESFLKIARFWGREGAPSLTAVGPAVFRLPSQRGLFLPAMPAPVSQEAPEDCG
jgi:hypothetical protein